MLGKTDESGVVTFEGEEGVIYTVHMLKVPKEYEKTSEEFQTTGTYCDIYIALKKAA